MLLKEPLLLTFRWDRLRWCSLRHDRVGRKLYLLCEAGRDGLGSVKFEWELVVRIGIASVHYKLCVISINDSKDDSALPLLIAHLALRTPSFQRKPPGPNF